MTDTTGASMERDFSNTPPAASQNGPGNGMMNGGRTPLLGKDVHHETARRQIQRAGSIALIPELFEKIYLTPQNTVKGDLRKTFGNLTPLYVLPWLCISWRYIGDIGLHLSGHCSVSSSH